MSRPPFFNNTGPKRDGRALIDSTTTSGSKGELAVEFTTSGAEELRKLLPKVRVVKALHTVLAKNQSTG
jgi:predicted dinucleotide-binding enzyme